MRLVRNINIDFARVFTTECGVAVDVAVDVDCAASRETAADPAKSPTKIWKKSPVVPYSSICLDKLLIG